jgi:hypothetical protein
LVARGRVGPKADFQPKRDAIVVDVGFAEQADVGITCPHIDVFGHETLEKSQTAISSNQLRPTQYLLRLLMGLKTANDSVDLSN